MLCRGYNVLCVRSQINTTDYFEWAVALKMGIQLDLDLKKMCVIIWIEVFFWLKLYKIVARLYMLMLTRSVKYLRYGISFIEYFQCIW